MNNDRIQDIKKDSQNVKLDDYVIGMKYYRNVNVLLSEVERLQTENKALQKTLELLSDNAEKYIVERVKAVLSHLKG